MGRRTHALVVGVVVLVLVSLGAPAIAHADAAATWLRPVPGEVAKPFDPPRSRFGGGHLGVDLAATTGTEVRAAGPGTVSFAGSVAGGRHVVIAHAGNLRTSYSFLASVNVRRGATAAAGDVVGISGGVDDRHRGSVLHFGLRSGETYLDPMALFRTIDLTKIVHLAPTTDAPRPQPSLSERRGLLAGLVGRAGILVDAAGHVIAGAGKGTARALAKQAPLAAAGVEGTAEWLAQRRHCDAHAPPADGTGGSGHRVMMVAGIDSSYDGTKPALDVPATRLGYQPGEVTYFSYAAGRSYTLNDSEGPIMVAVHNLATQLRAMQQREPGREVDLLADSQGGVVVEAFLALVYKRADRSYPPLGTVVTLSSPLRGSPIASAVSEIAQSGAGKAVLGKAAEVSDSVGVRLPLLARALRDLSAGSDLMRRIDAAHLPEMMELTTIGAATDVLVPGNMASRPGASGTTVIPHGPNAHTAVLRDSSALRVVRSALEQKPMPCQSLTTVLAAKLVSTTISTLEERAGQLGAAFFGRVTEGKQ